MSILANSDLFIVQRPSGGDAGTYKIEWESILDNIAASPAVQFKGSANFTDAGDDPAPANNGDLWVNTTAGTFAWANPEEASKAVEEGDYCIWDADDGVWRFIGSVGGGGGAVSSVDATAPLLMNGGATEGDVVVESREASETQSGHVARLATDAEVAKDGSGGETAVVTADQLRATNTALDAATAGGVTDVNGVNPKDADIPDQWKDSADTSTYATPAINVYDSTGNKKDVYVKFATENQVGVSYVADAGTGAIMDFTGAENWAVDVDGNYDAAGTPFLGGNLDNHGMMTTRRTYNNFVPRDFDLLNELPS